MTSVEKVVSILKYRKIPVSKMERECGFGNGYIRQLKKGSIPAGRLAKMAEYLDIPFKYLLPDSEESFDPSIFDTIKAATQTDDGIDENKRLLIQLFDYLPADRQEAVIRQLQEIVRLQKAQDDLLKF